MTMIGDTFQLQTENKDLVGAVKELREVSGQTHALSVAVTYSENIEAGMTFRTASFTNINLEDVYWTITAMSVEPITNIVQWKVWASGVIQTSTPYTGSYTLTTPSSTNDDVVGLIEITIADVASAKNLTLQGMQNEIMEMQQALRRMQGLPEQIGIIITSTPDNTPAHYPTQNPWFRASLDRVFTSWAAFQNWYNANLQALSTVRFMHIYVSEYLGTTPNPNLIFHAGCRHIFYGLYERGGGTVWSTDDDIKMVTTNGAFSVFSRHPLADVEFHAAPINPTGTSGSIGLTNFHNISLRYPDIQLPPTFTFSANNHDGGGRCFIADGGFSNGNQLLVALENYNVLFSGNPIECGNWRLVNCDVRFSDDDALEASIPFLEQNSESTVLRGRSTNGGDHNQIWYTGYIYDPNDGMIGKARQFVLES
ncbi:MAG: hypothetical protein FWB92_06455 [Oscillospiraceae bacterium]|nr:hypothetical protein [Oscillospiraceae bacterium]